MAAAALLSGCAAAPRDWSIPKVVHALELAPYASHDECLTLGPHERLDYQFESSQPVSFNLHYREGAAVIMPLVRDNSLADSAIYVPDQARRYCLSWEAGPHGARLDYRVVVHAGTRR